MDAIGTNGIPVEVLLVEDHPGDVRLMREAFKESGRVIHLHVAGDGLEALAFLQRSGPHADAPRPDLVLLDLNLPQMDGREVLAHVKEDKHLKTIPVVVLTASKAESDIERSYDLQASAYMNKPVELAAFESVVQRLNASWLGGMRLPRNSVIRALVIEADAGDAVLLRETLMKEGSSTVDLISVTSMQQGEQYLAEFAADVILLGVGLPDAPGLQAVWRTHAAARGVPIVVLGGWNDAPMATQALQQGADHFLIKGQTDGKGLILALRYVVERKGMEIALFGEKERAQVTLHSIGDAVVCTDTGGNITFMNAVAEENSGWSRQEAKGRGLEAILRIVDPATREVIANPIARALRQNRTVHLPPSSVLIRRDGMEIPIEDAASPIHDREGVVTGAVIVFRDVTKARSTAMALAHSAEHDFLTGLPNRRLLTDRIDHAVALARRHAKKLAVLFLDLDGFKHVNDSLGHPIGDELLKSIAHRLLKCIRGTDTVSRHGGDEFIVLLSELAESEDAAITAARMLQAVAEPHEIENHSIHVSGSVGIGVYPHDGLDAGTLIHSADTAMYQAKENGRQRFRFFEASMNLRATERQFIEGGLQHALERQELAVHYQPKIDLASGVIIGGEALLRWVHPQRGAIPPDKFIAVAESSGQILQLGAWVLRQACKDAKAWNDLGLPPITVAVNVSGMELRSETFVENVTAILAQTRLDPTLLVLEFTEAVLIKQGDSTAAILGSLRSHGIHVAIDDFGTGYSSLSYLQAFPVDSLKIHQSFIQQIGPPAENKRVVTAAVAMAKSLGLRVVAEGVESVEELAFLRAIGCDEAQGFFFSPAVSIEGFCRIIKASRGTAGAQTRLSTA